jgi:hypothetical protein
MVALLGLLPLPAAAAQQEPFDAKVEYAGDMLQVGVPLVALGLTFLFDSPGGDDADEQQQLRWAPATWGGGPDWLRLNGSPRHDLMLAIGRTELATYGLKYSIDEQRPNGHGESFPSGHTAIAFAGAEFIRKQYGWGWGLPAYVSAGIVGWSRVEAGKHWTHDVLAGAAIGILSNHDDLSIGLPFGSAGTLSIAPMLGWSPARPSFAEVPPDSILEAMEPPPALPGAGLRFEVRF